MSEIISAIEADLIPLRKVSDTALQRIDFGKQKLSSIITKLNF